MKALVAVLTTFLESQTSRRNLLALLRLLGILLLIITTFSVIFHEIMAGVTHILRLEEMMGQTLSRRVVGGDSRAHEIGAMGEMIIAEAGAGGTRLAGKTIAECGVRAATGVTLVGIWERGKLIAATPDTLLQENSVFVLGGTREQIEAYNETFGSERTQSTRVVILGGGRVGRATARALDQQGVEWTIIAIEEDGQRHINPDPGALLREGDKLVLIGSLEAEEKFFEIHKTA